jgi:hypothetical protein
MCDRRSPTSWPTAICLEPVRNGWSAAGANVPSLASRIRWPPQRARRPRRRAGGVVPLDVTTSSPDRGRSVSARHRPRGGRWTSRRGLLGTSRVPRPGLLAASGPARCSTLLVLVVDSLRRARQQPTPHSPNAAEIPSTQVGGSDTMQPMSVVLRGSSDGGNNVFRCRLPGKVAALRPD